MSRIAVLGAGGFVGQALLRRLAESSESEEIVTLGRDDFNLAQPDTWGGKLEGVDCVINAAVKIDGKTLDIFCTNTAHVCELAQHLNKVGVKKLINLSTGAVYGPVETPTTPDTPCAPAGDYAVSKYVGEHLFHEYFSGCVNTLRLYYPYGHDQKEPRLIPRLTRIIGEGGTISCDLRGGPFLSLSHVDDVAAVIVRDFVMQDRPSSIHNVASGHAVSIAEIAKALGDRLGTTPNLRKEGRARDVLSAPYPGYEWRPFRIDWLDDRTCPA